MADVKKLDYRYLKYQIPKEKRDFLAELAPKVAKIGDRYPKKHE